MKPIEILKDRSASHVYRLAGAGPDGSNVVAKRCPTSGALIEQTIYQDILGRLPLSSLRYYGLVEEPDSEFCWVFVEDAGKVAYSPGRACHGRLAAEWLAHMHTSAQAIARSLDLPQRGPSHYLGCLRSGRDRISSSLGNPALSEGDRVTLTRIARQCDAVEGLWRRIEDCCAAAAPTFVHADLHPANIHVSPDGNTVLLFDWESAGWGSTASDLALPGLDLTTYSRAVCTVWPELEMELVESLAAVGRVFQLLAHVEWESRALSSAWLHRPMKHMNYYMAEMTETLRMADRL